MTDDSRAAPPRPGPVGEAEEFEQRVLRLRDRLLTREGDPYAVAEAIVAELSAAAEELRVGEEELRAQNEMLVESRRTLEAERGRYRDLFEFAPTPYVVTDVRGVIREVNGGAAALLNADARFLTGKPLASFLSLGRRRELRDLLSSMPLASQVVEWETEIAPRRRTPLPVDVAVGGERDDGGVLVGLRWLLRDASRRRSAEQTAQRFADELSDAHSGARPGDRALADGLAELGRLVIAGHTLESFGERVSQLAVDAVPAAAHAGVALLNQEKVISAAAGDPLVGRLDRAQFGMGEGPTLLALADSKAACSGSLGGDDRFPRFGPRAAAEGIRSVLAVPLYVNGGQMGVLALYAEVPDSFDEVAQRAAERFAVPAAVALANAMVFAESERLAAQLQDALASRAVIEQAKGILMARGKVPADEAFARLRSRSQREHLKLRELAERTVREVDTLLPRPRD